MAELSSIEIIKKYAASRSYPIVDYLKRSKRKLNLKSLFTKEILWISYDLRNALKQITHIPINP